MSVYSYKCPNCSASLEYNPKKGKLTCDYCNGEFTREDIDKYLLHNPDKIIEIDDSVDVTFTEHSDDNKEILENTNEKVNDYDETKIRGYHCSNCAAEVITDDTTLTTFCYYCHSPVVITDRIKGDYKIDEVIPFKFNKKEATNKFLTWAKSKKYIKKDFYSASQLEKITGMYLPYWSVDVKYDVDIQAKGYKTEVKRVSSSREEVKTSNFEIERKGFVDINNVNELSYTKIDQKLIDSITPYNFKEVKPFEVFYLNGFFSETYNLKKSDVEPKIENRINQYKNRTFETFAVGYSGIEYAKKQMSEVSRKWKYVLLPTWLLTYDYNNKKYVFAVNGQTGKIVGEIPIDKKKVYFNAAIFGIIVMLLVFLGGYFL